MCQSVMSQEKCKIGGKKFSKSRRYGCPHYWERAVLARGKASLQPPSCYVQVWSNKKLFSTRSVHLMISLEKSKTSAKKLQTFCVMGAQGLLEKFLFRLFTKRQLFSIRNAHLTMSLEKSKTSAKKFQKNCVLGAQGLLEKSLFRLFTSEVLCDEKF